MCDDNLISCLNVVFICERNDKYEIENCFEGFKLWKSRRGKKQSQTHNVRFNSFDGMKRLWIENLKCCKYVNICMAQVAATVAKFQRKPKKSLRTKTKNIRYTRTKRRSAAQHNIIFNRWNIHVEGFFSMEIILRAALYLLVFYFRKKIKNNNKFEVRPTLSFSFDACESSIGHLFYQFILRWIWWIVVSSTSNIKKYALIFRLNVLPHSNRTNRIRSRINGTPHIKLTFILSYFSVVFFYYSGFSFIHR